jgi:hypothetical protein
VDICIKYSLNTDQGTWSWPWSVDQGHLGAAIAVVERVKQGIYTKAANRAVKRDPFEKVESDQKVCIHYNEETDDIGVSLRNLSNMQALEGLCEAQYSMQEQWFGKVEATQMAVPEGELASTP